MRKEIRFNAFDMNCVGHIQHGMWTHPRDRSTEYNTIRYWQDLARLAERGKFDGIFLADIVGVYDVYRGGPAPSIVDAVQIPVNDPMVTEHVGFGVTADLTYEPPYLFARRMSTLDHLTGGRVGWNIVTGYLDSAAGGMGFDGPARPRWSVRRRRRVHVRCLSVVGGELGRRRRAARQEEPYFRRSRQNPPRAASRAPLSGGCRSPVRAVAAADAGAVPGRLVESRPRV
jgi:alkanesulfonate monooxygenase SsuD/methylene tetrahydromethanopterin reductase-like flavin-dependent oxidoreductase (luciferase family)